MEERYDITIVEKLAESEYRVYCIYPNEDNECATPTLWESKHRWDGIGTINQWCTEIECDAYIYEEYSNYQEILDEFTKNGNSFRWFENETDIENNLSKLVIGQCAICKYVG